MRGRGEKWVGDLIEERGKREKRGDEGGGGEVVVKGRKREKEGEEGIKGKNK